MSRPIFSVSSSMSRALLLALKVVGRAARWRVTAPLPRLQCLPKPPGSAGRGHGLGWSKSDTTPAGIGGQFQVAPQIRQLFNLGVEYRGLDVEMLGASDGRHPLHETARARLGGSHHLTLPYETGSKLGSAAVFAAA